MVHRTMGLPHKSEPKNSYCVIWVYSRRTEDRVQFNGSLSGGEKPVTEN